MISSVIKSPPVLLKMIISILQKYYVFLILVVIFLALAYQDPFSTRSLVANLEPYPDTLYYSIPAWNLVNHGRFDMSSQTGKIMIENIVSPLYSLYLTPFLLLTKDIRVFYFANIVLAILTILCVYLSLKEVNKGSLGLLVTFLGGIVLVTNEIFYKLPSLLMAENLSIFVSSFYIYLLCKNRSFLKAILAGLSFAFFPLIKTSNIALGIVFLIFYSFKYFSTTFRKYFIGTALISVFLVVCFFLKTNIIANANTIATNSAIQLMGTKYFLTHFVSYLHIALGNQGAFLWAQHRLLSREVLLLAFLGLFSMVSDKKYNYFGLAAISTIIVLIVFQSFFVVVDLRYIIVLLPLFVIGFSLSLSKINDFFVTKSKILFRVSLLVLIVLFADMYLLPNTHNTFLRMKRQIGINFIHTENPWNYLSIIHFNNYFAREGKNDPILMTVLPIYYVEYFANRSYSLLPLSKNQEFFLHRGGWSDFFEKKEIYEIIDKLLAKKAPLYVSNAYITNAQNWTIDYEKLKKRYEFTLASQGCEGWCDIFRISLK